MRSIIPLLLVTTAGCDPVPDAAVGSETAMQVVLDTAVFEASAVFQVHVLRGTTKSGSALTCSDIPGNYRIGDAQIEELVKPAPTAQKNASDPTQSVDLKIRVPAEQDLVIVARGLAPYKGTFVVGRGCRDNLKLQKGSTTAVPIDVKATTGRTCSKPSDCEPNVTCLQGPGFSNGYCAVTGCAGGAACPPGAACISDTAFSGICMRRCKNISDCEIVDKEPQNCEGRLSLTSQGCDTVCAYPLWQKSSCCPPSACGTGDGGV